MTMTSLPLGRRQCECMACGERFGGVEAFDVHRTGNVGVREGPRRRRCMTLEEMGAAGLILGPRGWGRRYDTPRPSRIGGKAGLAA